MRRSTRPLSGVILLVLLVVIGCGRPARQTSQTLASPVTPQIVTPPAGSGSEIRIPSTEELLAASGASIGGPDGLLSGGPAPDGIPAIDHPKFVPTREVNWIGDREPVGVLVEGDIARAYPLQILMWHEIVNDMVDDLAVAVTYCPLCNSFLAFDRDLDGERYSFGTSGMLWRSDLVMYDRQTLSLWTQMAGRAIYGKLAGKRLQFLSVGMVSWADFRQAYPNGQVLSRDTGYDRPYGSNPYVKYDSSASPFLFDGSPDKRLAPMDRVLGITGPAGGIPRAWAYELLAKQRVVQESGLAIFYFPGVSSALDAAQIEDGRDVGTTGVFVPKVAGQALNFEWTGSEVKDRETGSTWDVFGRATAGPMVGQQLVPVSKFDVFWFAWAAFYPTTDLVN